MTPADRLVIRGGRGSVPAIPQLRMELRCQRHLDWPAPGPASRRRARDHSFHRTHVVLSPTRPVRPIYRTDSASHSRAIAKSFSVNPPASWVVSASVTLSRAHVNIRMMLHLFSQAGHGINEFHIASGKSTNSYVREMICPLPDPSAAMLPAPPGSLRQWRSFLPSVKLAGAARLSWKLRETNYKKPSSRRPRSRRCCKQNSFRP